jgi:hypothetical protein
MMVALLIFFATLAVLNTVQTAPIGTWPSVIGTFQGLADWYEFQVDLASPASLGGEVSNYQQDTRLTFLEQEGPFFRGKEYYADSTQPDGWKFVANLFGIMSRANLQQWNRNGDFVIRINEWLNQDASALDASTETVGSFTGYLVYNNNSTGSPTGADVPQMYLEYTGQTKARNKFGAQHFVAKLVV